MHDELTETLRDAQRLGFFGPGPIEPAIEHARAYLVAIGEEPGRRLADLGSGGGLPGLVIASDRPDLDVTLIDRRQKRTDFLQRAVARLCLSNTAVWCRDVSGVAMAIEQGGGAPFDVVTARGFGPPGATATVAQRLLGPQSPNRPPGRIVISEPPSGDRWDPTLLVTLRLTSSRLGPVRLFVADP